MGKSSLERRDSSFAELLFVRTVIAIKTAAKDIIPFDTLIAEIDCFSLFISNLSYEHVMHYSILAGWSVYNKVDIGLVVRPSSGLLRGTCFVSM